MEPYRRSRCYHTSLEIEHDALVVHSPASPSNVITTSRTLYVRITCKLSRRRSLWYQEPCDRDKHHGTESAPRYFDPSAFLLLVTSRAAFKPRASFTASLFAQKCM